MVYPASLDTISNFWNPNGTTLLSTGHSQDHRELATVVISVENVLGTTAGTAVLKNFSAGDFPVRINTSNVLQQPLNAGTFGTAILGTPSITGGTINTIKVLTPVVGTLTDSPGGTITHDMANGQLAELTLGTTAGNRTLAAPSNVVDGQLITYRIKQNSGNTGTIVWQSGYRFDSSTGTATVGTQSTWNYFAFRYNNTDSKLDFIGQNTNII